MFAGIQAQNRVETNPMVEFVSRSSTPLGVCSGWEKQTLALELICFPHRTKILLQLLVLGQQHLLARVCFGDEELHRSEFVLTGRNKRLQQEFVRFPLSCCWKRLSFSLGNHLLRPEFVCRRQDRFPNQSLLLPQKETPPKHSCFLRPSTRRACRRLVLSIQDHK